MDEENLILKSWNDQVKIFTENLAACRKRPTKDSVHDLRVAIKRMRSYLRLKQEINGDKWKEMFANTSALFKSFGNLRDFDMTLSYVTRYEHTEQVAFISFRKYLFANRTITRNLAKQDALQFNEHELDNFTQQLILFSAALSNEEIITKIVQLSGKKIKKAKALDNQFHKNAHEIRKILKYVYYWLMICPGEVVKDFIKLKELNKMLDHLGDWQDHFILKEKVKVFLKEQPVENDEKEMLKDLGNQITKSQRSLLAKARKKWEEVKKEKGD